MFAAVVVQGQIVDAGVGGFPEFLGLNADVSANVGANVGAGNVDASVSADVTGNLTETEALVRVLNGING